MYQSPSILIVGLGDLGLRIALRLGACADPLRLLLAARDTPRMRARAALVAACAPSCEVVFVPLDALDGDALHATCRALAPDALVQCASMHSPWLLHGRHDPVAQRLRAAGFACELSAQLPVAHAVFAAAAGLSCLRVNCSYPDVVNPVLAAAGLAPDIGIGNAGMIHALAESALRQRGIQGRLHTLAHHAHVTMTATGCCPDAPDADGVGGAAPRFFLDGRLCSPQEIFDGDAAPGSSLLLNELTAAHAVSVLRAYFGWTPPFYTAAPGPQGRAGGWPLTVSAGRIEIDLPEGISDHDIQCFNAVAARLDGVERIEADGTVHFTAALRTALGPELTWLAEPLTLAGAPARYAGLGAALGLAPAPAREPAGADAGACA